MTEIQLTYIALSKLLIATFLGFVYSRAGRGWKVWGLKIRRRVYLPLILVMVWLGFMIIMGKFNLFLLLIIGLTFPIYYGTLSIGYGAGSFMRKHLGKIPQQFLVGALQGGSCVLIAWYTKSWGLYSLSVVVPSVVLGTLGGWADNDTSASFKEALVGISIFLFPLFMI